MRNRLGGPLQVLHWFTLGEVDPLRHLEATLVLGIQVGNSAQLQSLERPEQW